ncbi:MAG TPA: phosphoribosyltransferase [Patescibacteria group bacterium]
MTQLTIHDQAYEYYSWDTLGKDIFNLSKAIIESHQKFDRIIALAKGGLTFSRSLVDFLQVDNISTMQVEFYTGIGTTAKTPIITQSLPVSIQGENVLVFDDIVDKGETMKLATQYLNYHGAESITTAALISKPWSEFKVDFAARQSQAWVIFPNEVRETIAILTNLWQEKGDSPQVIKDQLLQIGFTQEEVAMFSSVE